MPTLHRNAHFVVVHHVASGYVAVIRTATAFDSHADARRSLDDCDRALRPLETSQLGILLDWRLAPLSTDPGLHRILVESSDVFIRRFARRALLVQTSLGAMQGARIVRVQSETSPVLYNDPDAAVAYLTDR